MVPHFGTSVNGEEVNVIHQVVCEVVTRKLVYSNVSMILKVSPIVRSDQTQDFLFLF